MKFRADFITYLGVYRSIETEKLNIPSSQGRRTILSNHMPIMIPMGIGTIETLEDGELKHYVVNNGVLYFENNVAEIVRKHADRIAFAHIRNVKHFPNGDFSEASHRDCDGDVGILDIIKAYHDAGFDGYIRPDHGRHIWGEKCRPGYGLYDRALGIMYILGAWDMLDKK